MIEVQGLTKSYGNNLAINKLNFSVKKGEVVGFLGPNGAGKSTTMKIVTGFMAPTSGSVEVAGFDVFEKPIEVKKRIGYLPETPPLYMDMRIRKYLEYVAEIKMVDRASIQKNVAYALEKTDLSDVQNRLIGNLSKGFKQRVGIAQALVSDPEILILDEPTVGLDPNQVLEIRDLITGLKETHHTVLLSTHILSEVQATCERIIIINKGEIVAEDTLEGLNQKMSGTRQMKIRVRRPDGSFEGKIKGISGVKEVSSVGMGEFAIEIDRNDDVQEELAQMIIQSGAGLMEFRSDTKSLEDIFIQLTGKSQSEVNI